ncbi:hypothetical protein I4814_14715, partial [Staphylococcus aureus]|nr:hypothetical protein [Staphylococcus aureus]
KKVIENYIRNQLQEDIVADQISMEEYLDPFTGEKNKKRKKKEQPFRVAGIVVQLADLSVPF